MSEWSECNYCTLQRMRRLAEARGVEVIVEVDTYGWTAARYSDEAEPSARFLALTEECAC